MTKATQPLLALLPAAALLFYMNANPFAATPARADALMTGKMLGLLCTSKEKEDQNSCQSYIAGVVDYHTLLKSLGTAPSVNFCLPHDITMAQIKLIVTRYVLQRTEHRDFIAAPAVAMALFNAYPCQVVRRK